MRDETFDYGLAPGERFEPDEEDDEPFDLAQPHVMTALGPIAPDDLGFTLIHEDAIREPVAAGDSEPAFGDPARSLAELEDAFNVGLRAVVVLTTDDACRAFADVAWVARRSPVHLVLAAVGRDGQSAADESTDAGAARIVGELTEGIDGTGVRAGIIAVGEERLLRAAARAHLATSVPISTRADGWKMALDQVAILREEGVEPSRVIVGQLAEALDADDLLYVLETGAYVSLGTIGRAEPALAEARAAMVKRLVDAGYAEQLLVPGGRGRWSYFVETVPLLLMEAGLDAPTVRRIFVDNPAQALSIRR